MAILDYFKPNIQCLNYAELPYYSCALAGVVITLSLYLLVKGAYVFCRLYSMDRTMTDIKKIITLYMMIILLFSLIPQGTLLYEFYFKWLFFSILTYFREIGLLGTFMLFFSRLLMTIGDTKRLFRLRVAGSIVLLLITLSFAGKLFGLLLSWCSNIYVHIFEIGLMTISLGYSILGLIGVNGIVKVIEKVMKRELWVDSNDSALLSQFDDGENKQNSLLEEKLKGMDIKYLLEQTFFVKLSTIIYVCSLLIKLVYEMTYMFSLYSGYQSSCQPFIGLVYQNNLRFFNQDYSFFVICEGAFQFLQQIFEIFMPTFLFQWIFLQMTSSSNKIIKQPTFFNVKKVEEEDEDEDDQDNVYYGEKSKFD